MDSKNKLDMTNEKGSAQVIEMTLIFPLVLLCMLFLIYLCSYILQGISIYNAAQRIAVTAAREVSFPGYVQLYGGQGVTARTDFNWEEGCTPSISVINKLMTEHNPYRYWGDDFLSAGKKESLERNLEKLINNSSFITSSNVDCSITTSNDILNQQVYVRVIKHISLPKIISYFGLNENISIDVTATATVGDTAEFIRSTDMVMDLSDYIFTNLKIGKDGQTINEKISIYKQKFSDIGAKLGLEW